MAGAEKFEKDASCRRFDSGRFAANLWTQDNFQALDRQVKLPERDLFSSAESVGVIARGGDGFVLFDGQLLAGKDSAKREKETKYTGREIATHAQALGDLHSQWWQNEGAHHEIRKCNLFADRVYRDMHIPMPWDSRHIPTVLGMVQQLATSQDWELVYSDKQPLSSYKPQPGDFVLWDKTVSFHEYNGRTTHRHLEHSGVVGKAFCDLSFKACCSMTRG